MTEPTGKAFAAYAWLRSAGDAVVLDARQGRADACSKHFSGQTSILLGVADDRSRRAQQPVGLGLERSDGTPQAFLSGWKNGRGLA